MAAPRGVRTRGSPLASPCFSHLVGHIPQYGPDPQRLILSRSIWHVFRYLGLATIAVVLLELWRRKVLRDQLSWRRPTLLEAGLFVFGAFLLFKALSKILDY